MKKLLGFIALFVFIAVPVAALDDDGPFVVSENVAMDVERGIEAALNNNQLALLILGANWCHDTRSLTDNLDHPALKGALDGYTITLVNVNQFEETQKILAEYDQLSLYSTPTILIIDPKTGKHVNNADMHVWRYAYDMPIEDKAAYFEKYKDASNHGPENYEFTMKRYYNNLMVDIHDWETAQVERIAPIYEKFIGLVEDRDNRPEGFNEMWEEFWKLRVTITDDVAKLKAYAWERVNAGDHGIELDFPTYEKFDWEDEVLAR